MGRKCPLPPSIVPINRHFPLKLQRAQVPESDYAPGSGREDFRCLNVMSVDPPGCKDIDDALHVRRLANGNWEFGVHIADVTSFVEYGSAIDLEARARGTTVYLVQRRIDM